MQDPSAEVTPGPEHNASNLLLSMAAVRGDQPCLVDPTNGCSLGFEGVATLARRYADALRSLGLRQGDRVIVLLKPCIEWVSVSYALLLLGAVPVFIDPGLGLRQGLRCARSTAARALIGVSAAVMSVFLTRHLLPTISILVSNEPLLGHHDLKSILRSAQPLAAPASVTPDTLALIAFTSGSTGASKGVCFSHGVLSAQVSALGGLLSIEARDVQLAMLAIFALLGPPLGCTTVLAPIDPTRPTAFDAERVIDVLVTHRVSFAFAAPTSWQRIAGASNVARLGASALRLLLTGGAPISTRHVSQFERFLPEGAAVFVSYGATEAMPLTRARGPEWHANPGRGTYLGTVLQGVEMVVVPCADGPMTGDPRAMQLDHGEVGELVIAGPVVTPGYFDQPEAERLSKIECRPTRWHRMGDLGCRDAEGRFWFCGRKSERVETPEGVLYTAVIERHFEGVPGVARAALVGVGGRPRQRPVVVVELEPGYRVGAAQARAAIVSALRARARVHRETAMIEDFLIHPAIPLDVRHRAKILRHTLAAWAAKRLS